MLAAAIATEANRLSQEQQQAQQGVSSAPEGLVPAAYPGFNENEQDAKPQRQPSYLPSDNTAATPAYPATAHSGYAYPDPSVAATGIPGYGGADGNTAANAFATEQGYVPASTESSIQANQPSAPSNMTSNPQQASQPQQNFNMYPGTPTQSQPQQPIQQGSQNPAMYGLNTAGAPTPQNEWLRWGQGVFQHPQGQGQDYLSGANTLMTLRGTDGSTSSGPVSQADSGRQGQQGQGQWPLMLFDMGGSGSGNPSGGGAMGTTDGNQA
jgi:hypothetical protein